MKFDENNFSNRPLPYSGTYTRLGQAGLTVSADKVYIGFGTVAYLGYEVGRAGIRPDPSRAVAVAAAVVTVMPCPMDLVC